jgi:hypothetical protein
MPVISMGHALIHRTVQLPSSSWIHSRHKETVHGSSSWGHIPLRCREPNNGCACAPLNPRALLCCAGHVPHHSHNLSLNRGMSISACPYLVPAPARTRPLARAHHARLQIQGLEKLLSEARHDRSVYLDQAEQLRAKHKAKRKEWADERRRLVRTVDAQTRTNTVQLNVRPPPSQAVFKQARHSS